jgi:hypothetical protein
MVRPYGHQVEPAAGTGLRQCGSRPVEDDVSRP